MFNGKSLLQTLSAAARLLGERVPSDFRARLAGRTRSGIESQLRAVHGVREVLAALKLPYCVASNGTRAKMTLTPSLTGLLRLFKGRMFSSDDIAHPKPAPDLFLRAALLLGARPENCLVIEDTPTGVIAPPAASARRCLAIVDRAQRLQQRHTRRGIGLQAHGGRAPCQAQQDRGLRMGDVTTQCGEKACADPLVLVCAQNSTRSLRSP
jgi:HAD superfamily hydrolase (TIGR01509 family)